MWRTKMRLPPALVVLFLSTETGQALFPVTSFSHNPVAPHAPFRPSLPRSWASVENDNNAFGAVPSRTMIFSSTRNQSVEPTAVPCADNENMVVGANERTHCWAKRALLISSFTDGVESSFRAQQFLKRSLISALAYENTRKKEKVLRESVMHSPCSGPNIDALNDLEKADEIMRADKSQTGPNSGGDGADLVLKALLSSNDGSVSGSLPLRLLYIPTALYALRADSSNTPGKQRQRARVDGKKRRNGIVNHIQRLLGEGIQVLAVTLDLDDGSIKQPTGSDDPSMFPKDGKTALRSWEPHLIYVEGGNTFWLQYCMDKGDWTQDIISACTGPNAAVYCGKSAGAIVAGAKVETATWKGWDDPSVVPDMEQYEDWEGFKGMGLVGNASFFPHMDDSWEELVRERTEQIDGDDMIYSLKEWEACCVNGDKEESIIVGGEEDNAL